MWSSVSFVLVVAAFQPGIEGVGSVGADFVAEQVEGQGEMQVGLFLNRRQVDHPKRPDSLDVIRIVDAGCFHCLGGALDDAGDAGLADEHVVGFFGEHESAGAREWIEAGLGEGGELHLAVAVGEEGEHEEGQPVGRLLVEGAQHARGVLVAGAGGATRSSASSRPSRPKYFCSR